MNPVKAHFNTLILYLGAMVIITACTACPHRLVMDREAKSLSTQRTTCRSPASQFEGPSAKMPPALAALVLVSGTG